MLPRPDLPTATYLDGLRAWGASPELDLVAWIEGVAARDWTRAYRSVAPESRMIDGVDYRSGSFLFDWDFTVAGEHRGRVVAAFARSRAHLSVADAFAELAAVARRGGGRDAAVGALRAAILDARDANQRLAVRHRAAVRAAILEGEPSIGSLVGVIVDDRVGALAVPQVLAQLSEVEQALRAALPGVEVPEVRLAAGAKIARADLHPLAELADLADPRLLGRAREELRGFLVAHLRRPDDVLYGELARCSADRVEAIGAVLAPVFPAGGRRPRWGHAQAHYRALEHADAHPFPVDIGHFLSHSSGGPPNINFFLQERALNRGWSPAGRTFRRMEAIASEPGTVFFVRPIYAGPSAVPTWLEYGIFLDAPRADALSPTAGTALLRAEPDGPGLWLELFPNAPVTG